LELTGKRVLVTGADGFIGSHLVEALYATGCSVRALAYYNSFSSRGWLDDLTPEILRDIDVTSGDIRDRGSVARSMRGVEIVFHLAALIGIPYSYYSPESYVATNVTGTLNILEEARRLGGIRVLSTSTSEVYGSARYVPIDEKHPQQGRSPYAATKIGADRLSESYFRSFDLAATIVRPFNAYGPRQSARAVMPTIITQLLSGSEVIRLGSQHPTRDLVFVRDIARGFIEIAKSDATIGKEINIATGNEISIGDLASHLIEAINPRARILSENCRVRPTKSEVGRLVGSAKRLFALTGWKPGVGLKQGAAETIEWFREPSRLRGYKPNVYNI